MGVVLFLTASAIAQDVPQDRRSKQRGETPARDREVSGPEAAGKLKTWRGVLVDAGCPNRSSLGRQQAPAASGKQAKVGERGSAGREKPVQGKAEEGGHAHSAAEHARHADVEAHQVPDVRSRQTDSSCAISGATSAYALLLPNGNLLNLDQGGNTQAAAAFQATPEGQAVLSGKKRSAKPRAEIKARRRADNLVVESLRLKP
jgi:hypothetical protein